MVLFQIGMNEMFTKNANFSGLLSSTVPLRIDLVIHKAIIEINERYTEAAAASGQRILYIKTIERMIVKIYFQCFSRIDSQGRDWNTGNNLQFFCHSSIHVLRV